MIQKDIFFAFLRVGLLGFGGGPSSIPLFQKEVVEKYKWMTDEEFSDILAIGNTLPGPIATKMAGYLGFRVAGVVGMVNALIASVIPTVVLLILLFTYLASYRDQPWVHGMTHGVIPVVAVMMATLTYGFVKKSTKDFGWLISIALIIFSVIFISIIGLHPGFVIGALILFALLKKTKVPLDEKEKGESS
ncbi:chromate transporter [Evansella cellulosilytica]|uniref:Chromate transporter n=1 Tax=Evansella cellulosilytica (strain ATCC 21833 / DSM 2522 / FERM P-1141 / JCM 9156 / N-4) TaxID=649639 RepID=E6U203_EVAC2|nr:chromate transporter [Evansella cellulosilytica]ADU29247.1 Chromate transporter [Evansella cellulosilytica DSM 2522]